MGQRTRRRRIAAGLAAGLFLTAFALVVAGPPAAAQEDSGFGLPADDARRIVTDILDDPRFTSRVDETILTRIGRGIMGYLQRAINWFSRVVLGVGDESAGGRFVFWAILTVLIIAAAAIVASRLARRRSQAAVTEHRRRQRDGETESPELLEQHAHRALEEGRNEDAVRLFYQSGLIRLGNRGLIDYRPSLTSGEVADRLRTAVFDHIARTFDAVAYGHRSADPDEAVASRNDWQTLLGDATR